jgi:allophanate hydrolase subunit 2
MSARINDQEIASNQVHRINPGDILGFGQLKNGFRVYMAIKGGIQTELSLNSRSFYKPITNMNRISNNMELPYIPCEGFDPRIMQVKPDTFWKRDQLQVYPGPEFYLLDQKQQEGLFVRSFTVAKENNRMAYQLQEHLSPNTHSMLTSATLPGTVQLTPSGRLIILMTDGQTTGGYPRILQLAQGSINLLAQKKFGDKLEFVLQE